MRYTQKQNDEYEFFRKRAAQLFDQGYYKQACKLLEPLNNEQLKRFEEYDRRHENWQSIAER